MLTNKTTITVSSVAYIFENLSQNITTTVEIVCNDMSDEKLNKLVRIFIQW